MVLSLRVKELCRNTEMTPTEEKINEYVEWIYNMIEEENRDIMIATAAMAEIVSSISYSNAEEIDDLRRIG